MTLRKKRNYLHIIDMAKNKTVLQTLGFAFGESEVTFASQCGGGGGGCGVYDLFQDGRHFSIRFFSFKLGLVVLFLKWKFKRILYIKRGNKG